MFKLMFDLVIVSYYSSLVVTVSMSTKPESNFLNNNRSTKLSTIID